MMNTLYAWWRTFQEAFLRYIAGGLLLGLTLLAVLEVIRRYIFGVSFEWQQDAITFGILTGIFLFFGITQSRGAHLRVTVFLILLRNKGGSLGRGIASALEIGGASVGIGFCVWLAWRGVDVVQLLILQQRTTESLHFLLWPFFAAFLAGMVFMAISFAFQLYHEVCVVLGKKGLVDRRATTEEGGSLL